MWVSFGSFSSLKKVLSDLVLNITVMWCDSKLTFILFFSEPYEPKPVLGAALSIIRGHAADMDLLRVETRSEVTN